MVEKISITICGDGGCGKSSITLRLVKSQWTHEYDPTIEDSYSVTRHVDGLPYLLSLTDTAGQEEYRGLWAASNLSSDAFLLVYDITNPHSLDNLQYFLDMIDTEAEVRQEENSRIMKDFRPKGGKDPKGLKPMPVKIVAGNKCDLKDARKVSSRMGLEWARSRGCGFMETSAREMVNIEETFALIVRRVIEARRMKGQVGGGSSRIGMTSPTLTIPTSPQTAGGMGGYGPSPISASSQQPLVPLGASTNPPYHHHHQYNPSAGSAGSAPLQVNARRAPSPPPPLPVGGVLSPQRPGEVVEKSGFDDDGEGRKRGFWRRMKWCLSCGCFRGR